MDELYNILKRKMERGEVQGVREKLDVFYANDSLSKEQYEELISMLEKEE